MKVILFIAAVSLTISCEKEEPFSNSSHFNLVEDQKHSQQTAFSIMNDYCRSCHGVGGLRFFYSDEPHVFFEQFKTLQHPRKPTTWLESSIQALSWPSTNPPSHDAIDSRNWMPLGAKRGYIADQKIGDLTAREYLLNYLETL